MPGPKAAFAAYSLILATIFTTAVAQSPAHSPSPATLPAPFAPAPLMLPEPPSSMGGGAAPSPGLDCMPYLMNMTDCLSYVMIGSNDTKPDQMCCKDLANLVDTQPICLCQLLGNSDKTGFSIDISRALKLPAVCNVSTPPVSMCAAIGIPVPGFGPSGSPAPTPAGTLNIPTVPTPSGGAPSDGSLTASPSPGVPGAENNDASNLFISNLNFFIGFAFIVVLPYFL